MNQQFRKQNTMYHAPSFYMWLHVRCSNACIMDMAVRSHFSEQNMTLSTSITRTINNTYIQVHCTAHCTCFRSVHLHRVWSLLESRSLNCPPIGGISLLKLNYQILFIVAWNQSINLLCNLYIFPFEIKNRCWCSTWRIISTWNNVKKTKEKKTTTTAADMVDQKPSKF